jgi:hypothetical protein
MEGSEEEEKMSKRVIHKVNNQDNVPSGKMLGCIMEGSYGVGC